MTFAVHVVPDAASPPEQRSDSHSEPYRGFPYCPYSRKQPWEDTARRILASSSVFSRVRGGAYRGQNYPGISRKRLTVSPPSVSVSVADRCAVEWASVERSSADLRCWCSPGRMRHTKDAEGRAHSAALELVAWQRSKDLPLHQERRQFSGQVGAGLSMSMLGSQERSSRGLVLVALAFVTWLAVCAMAPERSHNSYRGAIC